MLSLFLFTPLFLNAQPSSWKGENYDKNSSVQYRIGVEAIESFDLDGHEKVLDIGCGNGKITALCASKLKTGSLIAIDNSSSMIEFAQNNYGNVTNLEFLLQDVTTMTFNEEFDFIYSIFCLHWVKDQEAAIKNIAQALKPGGKAILYISIPNEFKRASEREFYKLIAQDQWNSYNGKLGYDHYTIHKIPFIKKYGSNTLNKIIYQYILKLSTMMLFMRVTKNLNSV